MFSIWHMAVWVVTAVIAVLVVGWIQKRSRK